MTTVIEPGKGGLRAYLTAEVSQSPTQASLQRLYFGCVRFSQNPLAMVGLAILVLLLLVAIFAPLIVLVLWMGIYPKPFTDVMDVSVAELLKHVALSKLPQ